MLQPEQIIISHYIAVRKEIMERIRQRDRYLLYFATVSAAILGIYIKDTSFWEILCLVPICCLIVGILYTQTDMNIKLLSLWLRNDYTLMLAEYRKELNLEINLTHWDCSDIEHGDLRGLASSFRYYSVSIILLLSGALACIKIIPNLSKVSTESYILSSNNILFFLLLCTALGAFSPMISRYYRRKDTKFTDYRDIQKQDGKMVMNKTPGTNSTTLDSKKLKTIKELKTIVEGLKKRNCRIVTTNGAFDIIHAGHIRSFKFAKEKGEFLIVGLNSDKSIQSYKSPLRPVNTESLRAEVLSAIQFIDYIVIMDEDDISYPLISELRPHVHVDSEEYMDHYSKLPNISKSDVEIKFIPKYDNLSTTRIVEKAAKIYKMESVLQDERVDKT